MRIPSSVILFVIVLILVDLYAYKAIYKVIQKKTRTTKVIFTTVYLLITIFFIISFILIANDLPGEKNIDSYPNVFMFFALMLAVYLPKLIIIDFHLIRDISVLTQRLVLKRETYNSYSKDRREFITKSGIIIAAIPFIGTFYGIIRGRFNYQINHISLSFNNLPTSFNGLRIVQISDFHISCFLNNIDEVEKIVELINNEDPDIIVFTGDMINNFSSEMDLFIPILKKLKSKSGKYAITGNHDYGDYSVWDNEELKRENFNKLISNYSNIGFKLLRNEIELIKKDNDTIEILGVENWGQPPFPKYGDLELTMQKSSTNRFKILLSHDPSHWKGEVLPSTNIDLTLSGHTHGMQFGIEISGFKWSPVKYKYPEWAGLYKNDKRYLYVNRGIGYIGVAARVGIMPEITVFELK